MESSCRSGTVASNAASRAARPAVDTRVSSARVALLAVCCAASVANVYYAQPLLDSIARDFGVSQAAVGGVITATQLGCALALLFVVPLGDLLNRKRLITVQLLLLTAACIGVAASSTRIALLAGMVAVGLLGTAMTQGLIACSAALAGAGERGRVVGAAQGGVVIGLLAARSLAGVVTDIAGWRAVYLVSGALTIAMLVALARLLPDADAPRERIGYEALLGSMVTLLRTERVLRVRGAIALLMFAAFSIFWSALVLPLSAPPHAMSHTQIGAFGLVGALGAAAAARAGRLADRGLGEAATGAFEHFVNRGSTRLGDQPAAHVLLQGLVSERRPSTKHGVHFLRDILDLNARHGAIMAPPKYNPSGRRPSSSSRDGPTSRDAGHGCGQRWPQPCHDG